MNNARIHVGMQGVAIAERAFQQAHAFAQERKQGRRPGTEGMAAIIEHPDVRRMLMTMKGMTAAARAICFATARAIDLSNHAADEAERERNDALAWLLTPVAKAFGTDVGCDVSSLGIQVHGGMGFIEETGAAQHFRDARITPIYEGTNGIQAMDLVARKMMDGGEAAARLLDEIEDHAEQARATMPELAGPVWEATESLRETTEWIVAQTEMNARFAGAVPYLHAFARVLGAHYHLKAALAEPDGARFKLARFYINARLPEYAGLLAQAQNGADDLYALSAEELAA